MGKQQAGESSPDTIATHLLAPPPTVKLPPPSVTARSPRTSVIALVTIIVLGISAVLSTQQTWVSPPVQAVEKAPTIHPMLRPLLLRKRCEAHGNDCQSVVDVVKTKPRRSLPNFLGRVGGFLAVAVRAPLCREKSGNAPADPRVLSFWQAVANADLLLYGGAAAIVTGL